jgi:hypothetical protein
MGRTYSFINPTLIEQIANDIRQGCYIKVACRRAHIHHSTWYARYAKGEHEANTAPPGDPPRPLAQQSLYERFYAAMEEAKADAQYSAETRVFQTSPLYWLRYGYARDDWRAADDTVRLIEDAVEIKVRQLLEEQAANAGRDPYTLTDEQLAALITDMTKNTRVWEEWARDAGWKEPKRQEVISQ